MNLAYLALLALRPTTKPGSDSVDAPADDLQLRASIEEPEIVESAFLRDLRVRIRRHQQRRATAYALHALDNRTLADIGLTRDDIDAAVFGKTRQ